MVSGAGSARRKSGSAIAFNESALAALGLEATGTATGTADGTGKSLARIAIGFVDYGFDLLHPCLRDHSGVGSRFRYLWDQNRTPDVECRADIDLGRLEDWDGALLDNEVAAANQSGSRRSIDQLYDPHANNCGRQGTIGGAHGTMMASMAAGTAFAGFRGAAPEADLIAVQLALSDADWKEENQLGEPTWLAWQQAQQPTWSGWRHYDAAPQIINALRYIYDRACRLGVDALVINLSIGAWAGCHDGQSPVERALGDLIATADAGLVSGRGPRTVVVTGAGNSGTDEGHWAGTVRAGCWQSFDWIMQQADTTQNKLEIWYDACDTPLDICVTLPDGATRAVVPGYTHELIVSGERIGIAEHTIANNGRRSCIRILVHPPLLPTSVFDAPSATCAFTISATTTTQTATKLHAWVERDDGGSERSWLSPSHPEATLCCLATAPGVLVVAGYDHHAIASDGILGILPVSGLGPAPWAGTNASQIPHFAAPACGIWGAKSKSRGFIETTGTSAAVALTSGAIARHLAYHGANATLPSFADAWTCRYGHGPFTIAKPVRRGVAA